MAYVVDDIVNVLDDSPSPATEWASMREVFGDEALCRLVAVSEGSLRRYASALHPGTAVSGSSSAYRS